MGGGNLWKKKRGYFLRYICDKKADKLKYQLSNRWRTLNIHTMSYKLALLGISETVHG